MTFFSNSIAILFSNESIFCVARIDLHVSLLVHSMTYSDGGDADPSQRDLLWLQYSNTHGLQKSCGEKGAAWPLSKLERGPLTPAWTGFYCFSRPLTSKMVLLYYAKVCYGWLSFADKGEGVAEYIKEGYLQCKRRNGRNGYVPYLEGLPQILGR